MKKKNPIYKNIQMIISVPNSEYCWDNKVCCPYLEYHSNIPWCTMDTGLPKKQKNGKVRKTLDCQDLKEV